MDTFIRARIDSGIKAQVEIACKKMGISVSDYIRLSFARLLEDEKTPNDETQQAMLDVQHRKGLKSGNARDVMAIFNKAKT